MKTTSLVLVSTAVVLFGSGAFASPQPAISTSSASALKINSARVIKAPGGGSYVTGLVQTSFGYSAPQNPHVHVAVYDAKGNLLIEKVDTVNRNRLVRSHLNPRPRAPYVAFLPWSPSQFAKVTVVEHSGHSHSAS